VALKTITGKVAGPDGTNKAARITATLSQATIITGSQETVPSIVTATAASDGTYTMTLQANNDMTPNGTYYQITESSPDGGYYSFSIQVPQTAGPFVMSNLLTGVPVLGASPSHLTTLTVDAAATFTAGPVSLPTGTTVTGTLTGAADIVARSVGALTAAPYTVTAEPGSFVPGPDYGINPTASSVTVLGTTYTMGADKTGVADSGTALNNAILAAYRAKSFVNLATGNANFMTNSPLQLYRLTDTVGTAGPSILGAGSGEDDFAGYVATTKITAGPTFPIGEFLIDYIGSTTTTFSPLSGFTIGHLTLNGNSRAAGIRLANNMNSTLVDLGVLRTATPAPANTTGTPTGAVTLVRTGSSDYSYNNVLDHVIVSTAGKDCFHLDQTNSSSITARQCVGITGGRYSFYCGDDTVLIDCDAQNSTTGSYYIYGAMLLGCHEYTFPSKGNSIILDNPFAVQSRMAQVIGGSYTGTTTAGTEAAAAMVHFLWANIRASFVGVNFLAKNQTSDWVYVDAGAVTSSQVIFDACNFNPLTAPITQKFNFNGTNYIKFVNCPGFNPLTVTTPAVSTPLTNTFGVDIFVSFIANAGGTTFTVNGKALGATPANAQSGFIWPANTVISYVGAPASWAFLGQ
jgi:hypothetical protein